MCVTAGSLSISVQCAAFLSIEKTNTPGPEQDSGENRSLREIRRYFSLKCPTVFPVKWGARPATLAFVFRRMLECVGVRRCSASVDSVRLREWQARWLAARRQESMRLANGEKQMDPARSAGL